MIAVDQIEATETRSSPVAAGKFFRTRAGRRSLAGVTYGTFRPDDTGVQYRPELVERDFGAMAANGFDTVRVYTAPPRWLLDRAESHGLQVLVGLAWEQHIAFLDEPGLQDDILRRVEADVRRCAGHPAVFGYAVGNEIPATIVRWYGAARIERWIARLCEIVRRVDPGALVTYVNYPSTEYLQLPFLDFVAFNVYLEQREQLAAYLARLQNLAGDRPLVLAELGLDSLRNGLDVQADSLAWQLDTALTGGCAGVFVYAWTDEWYRGGFDIEDWDFGLVTRARNRTGPGGVRSRSKGTVSPGSPGRGSRWSFAPITAPNPARLSVGLAGVDYPIRGFSVRCVHRCSAAIGSDTM